jgi:alkylation response protein AidB-like acyl-CoA dehydrogenase
MDFTETDSLADHRLAAREWIERNVEPGWVEEQERTGTYHTHELHRRMARDGLLGTHWSPEHGGTDVDPDFVRALYQELSNAGLHLDGWVTTIMVLATVDHVGTEYQRTTWLPAASRGEMLVVLGYTEPESGSDVSAAKTRAMRDGDEWVINGSKMFTSTAHEATHVFLLARTNPDVPKHRGLTLFMVPLDAPGVEIRPVHTLGGQRTNATFYTDVRVPDSHRIGEVDGGWAVMRVALVYERGVGTPPSGPTWADRAAAWAADAASPDGSSAMDDFSVREKLVDIAIEAEMSRLLSHRVSWMVDTGQMPALEGPINKLVSTEATQRHLQTLMDIIGESAVLQGDEADPFPRALEGAFRKSVVSTIYGGSSEVMREIVAERRLGLPRARPSK